MIEPFFTLTVDKKTDTYGKFIIEPLPQGFGHTLGNSLRRILLTFLPGTSISFVKIKGVRHQFSTLPGLKEDIVEFILNLKNVHFNLEGEEEAKITLTKSGPGKIKASDIKLPANVTISNPDVYLGFLANRDAKIDVTILVEQGTGYKPAEERKSEEIGMLPVDSLFSPVRQVNFSVDETRVGRETNYDKITLEVTTNGSIDPKDALIKASQLLVSYASHIFNPKNSNNGPVKQSIDNGVASSILRSSIEELELSIRVINALKKGGFSTLGDFQGKSRSELEKVRNLGSKSIDQIQSQLKEKGIEIS
jgi:DNA-directed RNA polymerase subunit alpha